MQIRLLTPKDWQQWKQLRLEALQNSPTSFASSYEEESIWPDSNFQEGLIKSDIFGTFIDAKLVGCIGFYILPSLKTKHKGFIFGTYIKPEYRGKSIGNNLIEAIILHAKSRKIIQLHLTCVSQNQTAIKLYQKHGFKIYGTEPCALKIGEEFYDEHLMVLAN